jgi:hypothetical protein
MMDPLRPLARQMVTSRTIGFIGAGSSARVGYPLWADLLNGLCEEARRFAEVPSPDTTDPRWSAEVYGEVLERRDRLDSAVRRILSRSSRELAGPDEFHRLLGRLPFNHFITTNYDDLIEQACNLEMTAQLGRALASGERCLPLDGRDDDRFCEFLRLLAGDGHRSVLHLHGSLGHRITLTLGEYDTQYLHEAMLLRMFAVFATSTVVFIGASLRDNDVMELVRRSSFHGGGLTRHYAFLPQDRQADLHALRRSYGIEPIFYECKGDNHDDLLRKLERLLDLVNQELFEKAKREEPQTERVRERASGNAAPVLVEYGPGFDDAVETVKDHVRRTHAGGLYITLDEPNACAASRLLRRVATDYHGLPKGQPFTHVVWVSPSRIGLFPTKKRPRDPLNVILGELTYSIGRHRLTATVDTRHNIRMIRRILGGAGCYGERVEPALIVIDGVDQLVNPLRDADANSPLQASLFLDLVRQLPRGSKAIMAFTNGDYVREAQEIPGLTEIRMPPEPDSQWQRDPSTALEQLIASGTDNADALSVLCALALVATPIDPTLLAAMLGRRRSVVTAAVIELCEQDLCVSKRDDQRTSAGVTDQPTGATQFLGITSPVRKAVIDKIQEAVATDTQASGEPVVLPLIARSLIDDLLDWAETRILTLAKWEEDKDLLDELVEHLPNLLAMFEAACWMSELLPRHRSSDDEGANAAIDDQRRWLGLDLAYILSNVGRWAEADDLLKYLEDQCDRASDIDTFGCELRVLKARHLAHVNEGPDLQQAIDAADEAIDLAKKIPEIITGSGRSRYAPLGLTPARQSARAEVLRFQALLKMGKLGDARTTESAIEDLEHVLEDLNAAEGADEPETILIAAHGASRIAEARLHQMDREGAWPDGGSEILGRLDKAHEALTALDNRRSQGYQERLRGALLLRTGNVRAARRCLARALGTAVEFRDRRLEAMAYLDLAKCEERRDLAEAAQIISDDLRRTRDADEAEDLRLSLPFQDRSAEHSVSPPHIPSLILVVGAPGTGKAAVVRSAAIELARLGYDPQIIRFTPPLIARLQEGTFCLNQVDQVLDQHLATVLDVSAQPDPERLNARRGRCVLVAPLPTGQLTELIKPWTDCEKPVRYAGHEHPPLTRFEDTTDIPLSPVIVIHLVADLARLLERNQLRRSRSVEPAKIKELATVGPLPDGSSSWRTWFQVRGSDYEEISAEGMPSPLINNVTKSLGYSYEPIRCRTRFPMAT